MTAIPSSFHGPAEFKGEDLVCYCFKYTKNDIEKDFLTNGRSVIYERIACEKKAGGCRCAKENPTGT